MGTVASLDRLFDVYDSLVDDRVGIIQFVKESKPQAGSPEYFHIYAQPCDIRGFNPFSNSRAAGGASVSRKQALAKAIGEGIERYCSALVDLNQYPLVSYEKANFSCVPPDTFTLFSPEQYSAPGFPYVPFTPSTPVRWTPGLDTRTGTERSVPVSTVFVPYYFDQNKGEVPIVQPVSTGLACHCSLEEAAVSALCEVLERDAFLITWQASLAPPQVRKATLSPANQDLVRRLECQGDEITIFDLTMDHGILTILSVLRSRNQKSPARVFAASTSLSSEDAVRKSLEEIAHTRRLADWLKQTTPAIPLDPIFSQVKDQDMHVLLHCDHANLSFSDFLFASSIRKDFGELSNLTIGTPKQDFHRLLHELHSIGAEVILCDLTTNDVRPLGLWVIRAIIPSFHPLRMGHQLRSLGGTRLWTIPQQLGYPGIARETGDNPIPHPYP